MSRDVIEAFIDATKSWKLGDPMRAPLISHLNRVTDGISNDCSIWQDVEDLIRQVTNHEFLGALILDPRIAEIPLIALLRQMIRIRGLAIAATLLIKATNRRPELTSLPSLAAVYYALKSPCTLLKIARFNKERPVSLARAREVIRAMQAELQSGVSWANALEHGQDALRDETEHQPGQEFRGPTHLSYIFDGSATLDYQDIIGGRDLRTDRIATLPSGHLEKLFEVKLGSYVMETEAAIWLYYVEEYFDGTDHGELIKGG